MARQTRAQKNTVGRVMHEFKHGELETHGRKVRNPKQAIAIGLAEAGASRSQSPQENRRRRAQSRKREAGAEPSRAQLYAEAKRRNIPGRSHMDKAELARAGPLTGDAARAATTPCPAAPACRSPAARGAAGGATVRTVCRARSMRRSARCAPPAGAGAPYRILP